MTTKGAVTERADQHEGGAYVLVKGERQPLQAGPPMEPVPDIAPVAEPEPIPDEAA